MRIVLTAHPTHSHLLPLVLPIAALARGAGHEVAVATSPRMVARVEADGLTALALPNVLTIEEVMHDPELLGEIGAGPRPGSGAGRVPAAPPPQIFARGFIGVLAQRFAGDLIDALDAWKPDLVLRDITEYGGYLAAERLGVPHATLDISPMAPLEHPAVLDELNHQRVRLGLPPIADPQQPSGAVRAAVVPELFYSAEARPAALRCYRPPAAGADEPLDPAITHLPGDRPLVLASLGSTAARVLGDVDSVLDTIITVLGRLPVTGVVALGPDRDPARWTGARSTNVHLTPFVQQEALLPACDAFITHAGFNSIRETIGAGVPMVALPLLAEEPANARRLTELGIGIDVDPQALSTEALSAAVQRVLGEPAFLARAKHMQRLVLGLPPLRQLVEDLRVLVE